MAEPIGRIVFGSLLSLSVFGLLSKGLDWCAENAPWDTDYTKTTIMVIIAIIAIIGLIIIYRKRFERKQSTCACGSTNRVNLST